ncbi:hypothetical protein BDZ94DRAFT_697587 [Collybia nuda]|uniref:RRM domain-containing protein n=1 Tax=Collybia nuda TaxID=64659 RepID=A0A9P5Y5W7_9AGAR|nr:hypothetical protein BDZ94DRAFT_697587 [Collybia nuda]
MKVLRVGNLPPQIPEVELEATVRQFLKTHGSIEFVDFANDGEGFQRYCYVRFRHSHAARRASESITEAPLVFDDHLTTSALVLRAPSAGSRTLYFRGFYRSGGRLRQAFGEHSQNIKRIKILYDSRTGKHTGGGIIEFQSDEAAARALEEMNGRDVNGRTLVLRPYIPSQAVTEAPNP